ncbi:MAG: hypothetical protein KIS62_15205 [Ramlibacter sp.]|nr:hypothetical protein [Ramlibacter sp.]MBX3659838.1 hypothetical protein [Ramlibacter sp.]MCW5651093.1 hypothetical protein [Ramlibacter sp.]
MSLLSWLFPPPKAAKAGLQPESSGLSRMEATRPVASTKNSPSAGRTPVSNAQPGNRKSERMARRELLYGVVREAMTRSGMLSSSYKFKVLSLDARGRQFLVMMDLAREYGDETSRLAEIEALIAQSAKARHDIVVTAVYWRLNEHVAVGLPQTRPAARHSAPMPLESGPAPLDSMPTPLASAPAPLVSQPMPLPARRAPAVQRFEPIEADEVAAFKKALAAGVTARTAPLATAAAPSSGGASAKAFTDGSGKHGPQSYTLLTGYEDTEMPDDNPALSGTQYGALS